MIKTRYQATQLTVGSCHCQLCHAGRASIGATKAQLTEDRFSAVPPIPRDRNATAPLLSLRPPQVDWGRMLAEGRDYLIAAGWISIFPGLAIMVTVLGTNFLGDGLRDLLDPRLRRQM